MFNLEQSKTRKKIANCFLRNHFLNPFNFLELCPITSFSEINLKQYFAFNFTMQISCLISRKKKNDDNRVRIND